jgi:uncharacterized membrane protein YkvA (DUF1232 family)
MSSDSSDVVNAQVEAIRGWLSTYREDVARLRQVMLSDAPSPRARWVLAGVLSYQLRKMDVAPDWVPEIGLVDDAMVLRTGAAVFRANNALALPPDQEQVIERLHGQNQTVQAILGEHYEALFEKVRGLIERRIHGRTPEEILGDPQRQASFLKELDGFLERYQMPQIPEPETFHRQLVSYMGAKLEE